MMLTQCCSGGKANLWILLACVLGAWLVFAWISSVWRSKIIKIGIVIGLIASVAVVLAVKQSRSTPSGGTSVPSSPSGLPRLVDLGSGTCIPCKMMAPVLDELKKDYTGRLEVVVIDLRDDPDAATRYKVQVMPTQIFYDPNGQELFRHEGFFAKNDILAQWKDLGVSLALADKTKPSPE